jgi:hypothetical protein
LAPARDRRILTDIGDSRLKKKKGRGRFLKKAAQKPLLVWSRDVEAPLAQIKKVFLVLFLQKKNGLLN